MIFTGYYSQCEKNKRPATKLTDLPFFESYLRYSFTQRIGRAFARCIAR